MGRHPKQKELRPDQVNRIVYDAARLHESITNPRLVAGTPHSRALRNLSGALVAAVTTITGDTRPPWALRGSGHGSYFQAPESKSPGDM
jgi:hypothetical protein